MKLAVGCEYNRRTRRYFFRHYLPGERGRRSVTRQGRARTEIEARARLREWRDELEAQTTPQPSRGIVPTLREFVASQAWTDTQDLEGLSAGTRRYYDYALRVLVEIVGDTRLDALTAAEVERVGLALQRPRGDRRALASTTARDYAQVLLRVLRAAVEREVLPTLPVTRRVKLPKAAKPTLELTTTETAQLLEALHVSPPLRALVVIDLETGLRKSDLLALTWQQVDWEAGKLSVIQKKTDKPVTLPISKPCREALTWCRDRGVRSVKGVVLLDHRGRPWTDQVLRDAWAAAKKRAGITRRLRLHDLRHSFACALASEGLSLAVIQAALGHTSARSTERYARPTAEAVLDQLRIVQRRREGKNAKAPAGGQ